MPDRDLPGVAFPIHEFAHAWVAYRLGDGTAKMYGRLTLNPVVHFDPFGGLLPAITALSSSGLILGYGQPTPVNDRNLSELQERRSGATSRLAGPIAEPGDGLGSGAIVWRGAAQPVGANRPDAATSVVPTYILVNVLDRFVRLSTSS